MINEIKTQTVIYDITFRINPINNCYTGYISCSNREFAIWARHYNDLTENLSENNIPKEYANFAKTLTNDKIFYDDIAEKLNKIESPSPKQLIGP